MNKLEELYFLIENNENSFRINLLPNQITSNLVEIPCVNKYDAIYFMSVSFPLEFTKIKFNNKYYILNERFMEHCFKTSDMELDFISKVIKKQNINFISENDLQDNKLVNKIFESLSSVSKNLKDKNIYDFQLNKSLFILYLVKNYTNKTIKQCEYGQFLTKKDIMYTNILKNYKISFKQSAILSIDTHLKIIEDKQKNIVPCYYFLANEKKFRKVLVNKITTKNIEILNEESSDKLIIPAKNVKLYFYPPKLHNICTINDLFSDIIKNYQNIKQVFIEKDSVKSNDKEEPVENDLYEIIKNKFKNYSFPINYNRRNLDEIFEEIIYISILNITKCIIILDDKLYLHPEIMKSVPSKVKTLYFNILKIFYQSRNNNFESIHFNTKLYMDSIHFEVLKIICERKTILNNLEKLYNLDKIIVQFQLINKLRFASSIVNWKNIPKKTNIFLLLLKHKNLIFYRDKTNKNIISDNCDNRLKKIIKDPLDMFKYLKSEKDYIKWINIIDNEISKLYFNQFNVNQKDYSFLGKIMFRINSVTNQSFNDKVYNELLNISKKHKNLILDNYRINIKIKEYLSNPNLNLGYLAKHINSSYNEPTSFSSEETEIKKLKNQLNKANKKYYKYKNKYHKLKTLTNTETVYNTTIDINNSKDNLEV